MTKLIDKQGDLYFPEEVKDAYGDTSPIVLCIYPEGDCDTISWPNPNRGNLAAALYDAREQGFIDGDSVLLPDGSQFDFTTV